jgi:hypothetical protein
MWSWILLAVFVGGLAALLRVAAVRQRRHPGFKPIGQQHTENLRTIAPKHTWTDGGHHELGADPPARLKWQKEGDHGSGDDPPPSRR